MQHQKDVFFSKEQILKMGFIDSIIGVVIVLAFLGFVGSKIYDHEKEHLDPLIKKIKGWFVRDEGEDYMGPDDDYELGFKGQLR